ncbi:MULTISPECIES: prepilin-type N-terminal cleavage/methylation domain-containing protein [Pseudomonas]|uniref:prepilin-type N-terminal cleavage/methylation domain-containing protein n=1 Tax=Pseudomonas TaxID=286 RepID=UPI000429F568|nr:MULTISPECIES: prepilin-type N-terminal cleavage/methylation domain-containing protein [Pseudomonas]
MHARQQGMTLLEVLLAVLVLGAGLFAAAALQVKALQATDRARVDVQAALAAHSDRERAQP